MSESAAENALVAILGQHLAELRRAKGLTQEQVAHAAGVSRQYYQLLESGLRARNPREPANPSFQVLVAVSEAIGTPLPAVLDEVYERNAS
ncbi:helix-turn-helix domain-containing protein [Nocardia camponoti]|uniref:helix-turn-helix domain-containing protein n=1 Tax=Nocardia camponoti TaxID=1616106 RepID=UPI001E2B5531|nr:helix-turn-helix transcriptional regulator [Nocardia camponoti]